MNNKIDSTNMRQTMIAENAHYHDEKLGFGKHGTHEGWIKAEEAGAAANTAISDQTRQKMIADAAFYLAEKRGFAGNDAYEDWMKAEAQIDAMLHDRIGKS